jgi:ATP-dependent helicase/nuclease subunit B
MRCLSGDALKLLSAGTTVVTSSSLLASVVTRQFVAAQLGARHGSWSRPSILTPYAWLTNLWKDRRYRDSATPTLLSTAQELLLWQQVIESDHERLLDVAATARAARTTSLTLAQYEVPLKDGRWQTHHDAEQFAKWQAEVERRCAAEHWITMAGLWRSASNWLRDGDQKDLRLLLVGFRPLFPAMRRLVAAARHSGGSVTLSEMPGVQSLLQVKPCESIDQELADSARWARQVVEQGADSVGVLVPNLADRRKQVTRVFHDVFYPSHLISALNGKGEEQSLIHISGADSLRDHPIVAAALLVLDLAADRIPITHASALLRSPFIEGASEERYLRAQADLELRRYRDLEVTLRALERAAKNAPVILQLCHKIGRFLTKKPDTAEFPHWARFIAELLKQAGWPGSEEPRPSEQHIVDEWQTALGRLASLGLVSAPVSWAAAYSQLRRLLATPQPQVTDASSAVQILDPVDAAGLQFDHLWITGVSQEHWQFRINSSPFIPRSLQAEFAMPGATAASRRSQEAAAQKALLDAAPDVVASYSGSPLPMLASASNHFSLPRWDSPLFKSSYVITDSLNAIVDSQAPVPKTAQLRGGTSLIKDQSECPFRAFAKARLEAAGPEDGTFGFDPRERGGFLHRVFEAVWGQIKTQDCLRKTSDDDLRSIVDAAVDSALAKEPTDNAFHREITEAERSRLKAVTLEWLEVDKRRLRPFEVVQIEEKRSFDLNGVNIRLRIDRVDQLDDGKLLLIDYKSGNPKASYLTGDRPSEPQLLVYAASLGHEVEGILFARVKAREADLIGYSKDRHVPGNKVTVLGGGWEAQLRQWQQTVAHLANEFRNGNATVDPGPKACDFCDFKPLCRIQETRGNQEGEDE